ncbi:MAG TPA: glucose-6-phosphate isomerase, partial [Flavihumibacter sp.]|nr:glucose-6-phosphate isomerase [Flavihumibacter sp.]
MFPSIATKETQAWQSLTAHAAQMKGKNIRDLFKENADRFANFSRQHEEILIDFSKNLITA